MGNRAAVSNCASYFVDGRREEKRPRKRHARKNGGGPLWLEPERFHRRGYVVGFVGHHQNNLERKTLPAILATNRRDGLRNPTEGFEARHHSSGGAGRGLQNKEESNASQIP